MRVTVRGILFVAIVVAGSGLLLLNASLQNAESSPSTKSNLSQGPPSVSLSRHRSQSQPRGPSTITASSGKIKQNLFGKETSSKQLLGKQNQTSSTSVTRSASKIPHHLFIPVDLDTIRNKDGQRYQLLKSNTENTINLYGAAFDDPNAPVTFIDYEGCLSQISKAKVELVNYYKGEQNDIMKTDMCRMAALYNNGGYCLGAEVRVVEALVVGPMIEFATISSPQGKTFFQAWLASAPKHIVIAKTLDIMLSYYDGTMTDEKFANAGNNFGRKSLFMAYESVDASKVGPTRFLKELNLKRMPNAYSELPRQSGSGCCCNYVAHDIDEKKVYFFSRIPGLTGFCEIERNESGVQAALPPSTNNGKVGSEQSHGIATVNSSKREIPRKLIFTHQNNILETKEPAHIYDNVRSTIDKYRKVWGDSTIDAVCLDNEACIEEIDRADPRLLLHFQNEPQGKFKGDICRIAALHNRGGYYMDSDIKVIEPVMLSEEIEFSTVRSPKGTTFFQAWLASAPRHPVLKKALDVMFEYYEGRLQLRGRNMGCSALFVAYDSVDESDIGQVKWLRELNLDKAPSQYAQLERQKGRGCCCNYIVHDETERRPHFWSRIVGAGPYCDFLSSV